MKRRGKNEGSIRKRKDGKWEARYSNGRYPNGKTKQKSVYGDSQEEVLKKLNKIKVDKDTGLYIEPSFMPFEVWIDKWIKDYKMNNVKAITIDNYNRAIEAYIKPVLGKIKLKDLKTFNIQNLYSSLVEKGLSPSTVEIVHRIIKNCLEQAYKDDIIIKNVANYAILPKANKKDIRVLTKEEQKQLLKYLDKSEYKCIFILFLFCGLRRGELLALKWQDIDFEAGEMHIQRTINRIRINNGKSKLVEGTTKTSCSDRTIPLLDNIVHLLKKHRAQQKLDKMIALDIYTDDDYVFAGKLGKPIDPSYFRKLLNEEIKKAGIKDINIHALRHTFATRAIENKIDPKILQVLLGHSSYKITMDTYVHVMQDEKKEAMNKLKGLL